uniref:TPR_REGION domain-containing protein n=1 Tax=Glossina austeni TaxID=7395 RepID=A0A1A9V4T7_GLOAU
MASSQIISEKTSILGSRENQENESSPSSSNQNELPETKGSKALEKIFLDLLKTDMEERQIIKHLMGHLHVEMDNNNESERAEKILNAEKNEDLDKTLVNKPHKMSAHDMNSLDAESKHMELTLKASEDHFQQLKIIADQIEPKSANSLHNKAFCTTMQYVEKLKKEEKYLESMQQEESGEKTLANNESKIDESSARVISMRLEKLHDLVLEYRDDSVNESSDGKEKNPTARFHRRTNAATLLTILAFMHKDLGNFKEALRLLNEALTIRLNNYGEQHLAVVVTLRTLAKLYNICNMTKEANAATERASHCDEDVEKSEGKKFKQQRVVLISDWVKFDNNRIFRIFAKYDNQLGRTKSLPQN